MQLYEFGPSRALRVRWALQELGVDFQAIPVDLVAGEHRRPEFLAINPAGRLPVLVDGDRVVTESVAIVLYLAEKVPAGGLLGADLAQRAQVYRWSLFAATELEQPLWRIDRHTFLYPEADRSPADIALARRDFHEMAGVLDRHLAQRTFLVGERATAADLITAYTLDWANDERLLGDFPRLVAYLERMYARPRAPMRIAEGYARIGIPTPYQQRVAAGGAG